MDSGCSARPPIPPRVWPMIELPVALFNIRRRPPGHRFRMHLAVFVMGANDIAKELHAGRDGAASMPRWLMECVAAARI